MKKFFITSGILIAIVIIALALTGMYKFNYLANQPGYNIDGNKLKNPSEFPLCDSGNGRYKNEQEALNEGLTAAEFGATYCPEYKMHPSWDVNKDGINDCYETNSCSIDKDYTQPNNI